MCMLLFAVEFNAIVTLAVQFSNPVVATISGLDIMHPVQCPMDGFVQVWNAYYNQLCVSHVMAHSMSTSL